MVNRAQFRSCGNVDFISADFDFNLALHLKPGKTGRFLMNKTIQLQRTKGNTNVNNC